ncbi:MAG: MEKHLA domain-containing protein [Lentisphaeraceae bacterium]|nr:MEKHLA domain-containing protein [Lentisphaeraceae bacterium]
MSSSFSPTSWPQLSVNDEVTSQSSLIADSFKTLLGESIDADCSAEGLYKSSRVILSHDGTSDPKFTYVNLAAQNLWRIEWKDFIGLHSKYSAEEDERNSRQEMLQEALEKGYFKGYKGIRTSSDGKRFFIKDVIIFNLLNKNGDKVGQAAVFDNWEYLK